MNRVQAENLIARVYRCDPMPHGVPVIELLQEQADDLFRAGHRCWTAGERVPLNRFFDAEIRALLPAQHREAFQGAAA